MNLPSKEAIESAKIVGFFETNELIRSVLKAAYAVDVTPLLKRVEELEAELDAIKKENNIHV